jgi:hypothetical protein
MSSLRDIGYDLPSAVADLVDNAIDASSSTVNVDVVADGSESWIRVSDDGIGMSAARLDEAMRYGTRVDYSPEALGRYGLGLKTASLSQCRRLTIASRERGASKRAIRRWDLDEVLRRDTWELERLSHRAASERLTGPIAETGHGTVVLWEHLDRVLPRRPTEGMTARVLRTAVDEIRDHLAMVFHRFLDETAYDGRGRLVLTLNGDRIEAWDPFARHEQHTRTLPRQVLEYQDSEGRTVAVDVQPYVLPSQQLFSSPEAHQAAAGPRRWNRHQGFYIYRRDRLIQPGGWNRLRTLDEHAKLARIAVDLPLGEEQGFGVDVAKMRVSIPDELRPALRTVASGVVAVAQERYRDHLDAIDPGLKEQPFRAAPEAISISRDWPAIIAALDDVLGHDPYLRDTVLLRLANADPDDSAHVNDARTKRQARHASGVITGGSSNHEGQPVAEHLT